MPDSCQRSLAEFGHVPGALQQIRLTEIESPEHPSEVPSAWQPTVESDHLECDRCGNRVSPSFWRVWSIDGELEACPECVPRSVRFGEDVYGRDLDDVEEFDKDRHNEGRLDGGVRQKGTAVGEIDTADDDVDDDADDPLAAAGDLSYLPDKD